MELTVEQVLVALGNAATRCHREADELGVQGKLVEAQSATAGGEALRVLHQELLAVTGT